MTIAGGVLCPDGIVLCADTQETIGAFKRRRPKLVELPLISSNIKAVIVGATDNAVFLDELVEKLSDEIDLTDGYLASVRRAIEKTVRKYCEEIWRPYASKDDYPEAHLLVGLKTIEGLSLLEIYTPAVKNVSDYEFIGSGSDLAGYKAKHFFTVKMPVEAAACLAAYILEVVKDNNIFCAGPTQMAIIKLDGTVEHKNEEFSRHIGSALMKWDYFANRMGAMIPFVSVGGKPIIDHLLTDDANAFLDDRMLEKILFGLLEGRIAGAPVTVEEWVNQVAIVEKRGALNPRDASAFDALVETKKIIEECREGIISGSLPGELKQPLNELINAHNAVVDPYKRWRALVEQHQPANVELDALEKALATLNTSRSNLNNIRAALLGAQKSKGHSQE